MGNNKAFKFYSKIVEESYLTYEYIFVLWPEHTKVDRTTKPL